MFGTRPKRSLRIFFATDIHGSNRCFRKFLAAAKVYSADVLILGGDIVGKGFVPIQSDNGTVSASLHGDDIRLGREDLPKLRDDINRFGFYSAVVGQVEMVRLETDKDLLRSLFRQEITTQIQDWCNLAAERLDSKVRCIITPGNDDPLFIDDILRSASRIESPERQLCDLGPVLLASLGDVNPTPWNTDREFSEEELGGRITALLDQAPPKSKVVVNFHCPPYESGLDLAPELDANLRPVIRGGQPSVVPVGSTAVRDAIVRYRPAAGLHGHIHESRGAQTVGQTLCLNPGSEYSSDLLRGALVDFDADGAIVDFLLTAG